MACDSIPPVALGSEGVPSIHRVIQLFQGGATVLPHPREVLVRDKYFTLRREPCPGGVNFSVFSRRATRIELLLFDSAAECAADARVHPRSA